MGSRQKQNSLRSPSPRRDESIVRAYQRALSLLLKLVSGLAVGSVVVYVLGWLRSYGYYESFRAEWILIGMPFSEIASRGVYPLGALLFGLLLSFSDVAQRLVRRELRMVIILISVLLFFEAVAIFYYSAIGRFETAARIAGKALVASASFSMLVFGEIVLELDRTNFRWRSEHVLTLMWVLLSFGGVTFLLGSVEGDRDKIETTSTLPHAFIVDKPNDHWRLLTIREDMSYLVKLPQGRPTFKIINVERLDSINPSIESTKKKPETQGQMQ